jgi:predicted neuraminidase
MNGEVVLFYKIGFSIRERHTRYITSKDFGESWSEPRELVAGDISGGRGPVKNKPIRISNGNILAPGSTERGPWRCFVDIFDGKEWRKRDIPVELEEAEKVNVIQPTLWESENGHIHALVRSNIGNIYRSDSFDYGETWSPIYPTEMPNNNSGIDCVKLADGRVALLCNPISKNWGPRTPLSLFISEDNGQTFKKELDLETDEGGFAYPSVVESGGCLHIVYTYNRKKIVHAVIEI